MIYLKPRETLLIYPNNEYMSMGISSYAHHTFSSIYPYRTGYFQNKNVKRDDLLEAYVK